YRTIDTLVKQLIKDKSTYDFDEKQRQVLLNEHGNDVVEEMLMAGGRRPEDAWPPPVRGPAPGDRGQGRRRDPAREPDPGLGDDPELFPPLHQAQRYDRDGGDGGGGVRRHLQDGCVGDP